jgi:hypothetical protein
MKISVAYSLVVHITLMTVNLLYCSVWQVLLILLKSKLLATPGGEELEESQILPDTVINLFKG